MEVDIGWSGRETRGVKGVGSIVHQTPADAAGSPRARPARVQNGEIGEIGEVGEVGEIGEVGE